MEKQNPGIAAVLSFLFNGLRALGLETKRYLISSLVLRKYNNPEGDIREGVEAIHIYIALY